VSNLQAVINRHVGRPWSAQGFDCWAFLRAVYSEAYGIMLPVMPMVDGVDHRASARAAAEAQASGDWMQIEAPATGDAILMGKRDRPHHCGVWLADAGGIVAHCDQTGGVRCESMRHMTALGWGSFTYYRHRLRP
jgi:cell wall-associated NlpC family hydrolase